MRVILPLSLLCLVLTLASILIGLGVVMLMQPFSLWAYGWSFLVTLVGTVMFIVVSHFPD